MVAELLKASTTAPFDVAGAGGSLGLTIENDPGESGDLDIHLLLFPAVGATLRCDVGTVSPLGTAKLVDVPGGIVTMSGTTASLPKRADGENPLIQVLMAFDQTGEPISPTILYDAGRNQFTSDQECTAAISFTPYKTLALPFQYTPQHIGSVSTFGTIVAFYPPDNITTFDVAAFELDRGDSTFEMYSIVSRSITNQDGEFEKPPNFPTTGTYPDKALVLPTTNYVEARRVHEQGLMTRKGKVDIKTNFLKRLPPYDTSADAGYRPVKIFEPSSLPTDMFPDDIILKAQNEVRRRGQGRL